MTPVSRETLMALTYGISSEIASYVFYVEAAKLPHTIEVKELLLELAMEEKKHFQILERQHSSLVKSEQWVTIADSLKGDALLDINEEMTATHRSILEQVAKTKSLKAVLDIAYNLEESAYKAFTKQAEEIDSEEGKNIFNELAKFEMGHMKRIDEMRKQQG